MATKTTVINFGTFKVGDTPKFTFDLAPPSASYIWPLPITYNIAMNQEETPTSNANAIAARLGQTLTIRSSDNHAIMSITPLPDEAAKIQAGILMHIEPQIMKDGAYINTPVTGIAQYEQQWVFNT